MSLSDFFLGTTQENIDREVENYDPNTGKRKKDLGDILGDLFTGQGSVIDQGVKDTYKSNLEKDYGIQIARLKKELPNLANTGNLNITENTDKGVLKRTIEDLQLDAERRGNLVRQVQAAGYGGEIGTKDINALSQLLGDKAREKETKAETKADTRLANQLALQNRRMDITDAQNQRQQTYQNRVLDMKDAREARNARDKQLMMIIQGLNSFGQGFQ
ncbi:MAG: hypothetical protein ACR2M9_01750 [Cyanophyceae cyanobacterium]